MSAVVDVSTVVVTLQVVPVINILDIVHSE